MSSDVLSDVLRTMRAEGTVYFCDELQPPWEKHYSGEDGASFHQVRRGGCQLLIDDEVVHLGPGDLVFLAPGKAHKLISGQSSEEFGPQIADTLLLCGYCRFDESELVPFADLFPEFVIMRAEKLQNLVWLQSILNQLSSEYLSVRPGTDIVVQRMTEVLLVELIRMNFGQSERAPLLKALADKFISNALQKLHQHPEKSWSLESLSSQVGLSRAAFAKRFKDLVGEPMFEYLTQLRMQRARHLLKDTNLPLYEVAERVGYESDLAFTRTFKKRLGKTPTSYRKHSSETDSD